MIRRFIVGFLYCVVLYYATLFVVGVVAGQRAVVAPGQDEVAGRNQAALDAAASLRPIIAFVVVGVVFLALRTGYLPGARGNPSRTLRP